MKPLISDQSNTGTSNPGTEVVPARPATLRHYAASTLKVILLSGSLLGGLWLLQTVAQR